MAWEWCSGNAKSTKWPTARCGQSKCGLGVVFWEREEHKVAHNWLRALRMRPGNSILGPRRTQSALQLTPGTRNVTWKCVLGTRRTQSGLQLAPGTQNVAWEWCSGTTKSRKWPTVGSRHSECGLGMVFWEHEEQKVAYSLIRALKMWPGSGVLARCIVVLDKSFTLFEVMIFCVLAWLHRNDDESHEV